MKNIKPKIKSQTRVKSMFAFMHEDENELPNQEAINVDRLENLQNASVNEQKVIEEQTIKEEKEEKSLNEPVILSRTRGDKIIESKKKEKKQNFSDEQLEKPKSNKIVEVQSRTYGEKPEIKEKLTFKEWWKQLEVKIKNGWHNFIQKKGAVRFVILLSIMVIVSLGLIIHTLTNRTSINDLFQSKANAIVLDKSQNGGSEQLKQISLKSLKADKATKNNTMCYQQIELFGKDLDKTKSMQRLMFNLKTTFEDVTIKISLSIFYEDEITPYFESTPKEIAIAKNKVYYVNLNINQSIMFDKNTKFVITLDSYKTSDLNVGVPTPYDVNFSIYALDYLK